MNEMKTALAMILYALSQLCRFNAFAGCFAGLAYGMIAILFDREFFGFAAHQITLFGIACFAVFSVVSFVLVMAANCLVPDSEEMKEQGMEIQR